MLALPQPILLGAGPHFHCALPSICPITAVSSPWQVVEARGIHRMQGYVEKNPVRVGRPVEAEKGTCRAFGGGKPARAQRAPPAAAQGARPTNPPIA